MKKTSYMLLAAAALCLLLSGCGSAAGPDGQSAVSVVTTGFAPYDLTRQIAGERGSVTMLLPAGSESHTFEPTPKDIIGIQSADLFVYVGGESDEWVRDILSDVGGGVRTVTLMDCAERLYREETVEGMQAEGHEEPEQDGDGAEYDEHVWTSPRNAALICAKLCDALCGLDPEGAEYYRANLEAYTAKLAELDGAFREAVAGGARKTLIFADRFPLRYFTEAYGLEYYAAFPGCAEETEPSAATVAFLEDKVRAESIPVVFHIELSNEDMADAICADTGAKKLQWNACHNVTGAQLDSGVTYLELMWQNVDALKEALA